MKYKDALQAVMREIEILKKLDHPNVLKLVEIINDPEVDKMYIGKYEEMKSSHHLVNLSTILLFFECLLNAYQYYISDGLCSSRVNS